MDLCTEHLNTIKDINNQLGLAKTEIENLKNIIEAQNLKIEVICKAALNNENLLKYVVTPLIIIVGVLAGVNLVGKI